MIVTFIAIGLAAGVLSGLFGIGGGVLIVPALIYFAQFPFKAATGTSLGVFVLPVALLGAWTYYQNGHLHFRASALIALGLVVGSWLGARLAQEIPGVIHQRLFALLLAGMAVRLWIKA